MLNTTETSGRKIAKRKRSAFRRAEYGNLLAKVAPEKVTTKKQHREMSKIVDDLMRKGDGNRTPEEEKLMALLFTLVAEYESAQYTDYRRTPAEVIGEILSSFIFGHERKQQRHKLLFFGSPVTVPFPHQIINDLAHFAVLLLSCDLLRRDFRKQFAVLRAAECGPLTFRNLSSTCFGCIQHVSLPC